MTIKLEDVAKKAGVSVTTVSRVINNKGYLSFKTISKVEEAMKALHYQPNAAARTLQGKSLKLIGLVFPNISNVFYAELIEHIEHALFTRGYKTMLATTEHDEKKEREYLALLLSNQVDGIIYGSHNLSSFDYETIQAPIVAFDRFLTESTTVVSSDNCQGGVLATETLIQRGAREIAIITGDDNTYSPTTLRREGYLSVIKKQALFPHVFKVSSRLSFLRRQAELKKIVDENNFDGFFCTDDLTAILLKNLLETTEKKPSVIGFDGTSFIEKYYPTLTTIQQPIAELADLLVDLLIRKINGETIDLSYQLPVKLVYGNL